MSWLAIKYGIQKAWVWCRNNWKIVMLAVYTILLYLLFSKNARNAKKALEAQRLAHKAEVDALNKAFEEERKKKDENLKKYQEILRQIEQEYADRREAIAANKKKRIKEIVEEHGDDPQKLAELIKENFGFEIYTGEEND
tara:strand:- start:15 stop:434 length:420 start_codon:yes stop_codon:yes gene_type:complete